MIDLLNKACIPHLKIISSNLPPYWRLIEASKYGVLVIWLQIVVHFLSIWKRGTRVNSTHVNGFLPGSRTTGLMICPGLIIFQTLNPGNRSMIEPPGRRMKLVPDKAKVETASCPACGAWARVVKSEAISKNLRQKTFQCVNPDCGGRFIANFSFNRWLYNPQDPKQST